MNTPLGIGAKLKILRKSYGFTQKNVADALNVERSTYTYYETGKTRPDIVQTVKLAKMYNVNTDYLLGHKLTKVSKPHFLDDTVSYQASASDSAIPALSSDEKQLLLLYRQFPNSERETIINGIREKLRESEKNDLSDN